MTQLFVCQQAIGIEQQLSQFRAWPRSVRFSLRTLGLRLVCEIRERWVLYLSGQSWASHMQCVIYAHWVCELRYVRCCYVRTLHTPSEVMLQLFVRCMRLSRTLTVFNQISTVSRLNKIIYQTAFSPKISRHSDFNVLNLHSVSDRCSLEKLHTRKT